MAKVYLILVSLCVLILIMIGLFKSPNKIDEIDGDIPSFISNDVRTIEGNHFLIIGSFLDRYNAEQFQETMSDLGYQTKILESDDGYYRIYIFSSIYKDDVYQFKDKYSSVIDKMWVYSLN
jgi:hypothetical protein